MRQYLEQSIDYKSENKEFDYNFNEKSDKELFLIEYNKFLMMYNSVFYFENRLVTVVNSYEIRIEIC